MENNGDNQKRVDGAHLSIDTLVGDIIEAEMRLKSGYSGYKGHFRFIWSCETQIANILEDIRETGLRHFEIAV